MVLGICFLWEDLKKVIELNRITKTWGLLAKQNEICFEANFEPN